MHTTHAYYPQCILPMHTRVKFIRFNCYKQFINNYLSSETSYSSISKLAVFILCYELKPTACTPKENFCVLFVITIYKQLPLLQNLQMLVFQTCCFQSPLRTQSNSLRTKVDFSRFNCYKQFINNYRCSDICRCSIFKLAVFSRGYKLNPTIAYQSKLFMF